MRVVTFLQRLSFSSMRIPWIFSDIDPTIRTLVEQWTVTLIDRSSHFDRWNASNFRLCLTTFEYAGTVDV